MKHLLLILTVAFLLAVSVAAVQAAETTPAPVLPTKAMGPTFAEATAFSGDAVYEVKGKVGDKESLQYLKLENTAGQGVDVKLTGDIPKDCRDKDSLNGWCDVNVKLALFNANREEVVSRLVYGTFKEEPLPIPAGWYIFSAEQPGPYFLQLSVSPRSSSSIEESSFKFGLEVKVSPFGDLESGTDAPETFSNASPISPGSFKGRMYKGTHGYDLVDTYSLNLPKYQKASIRVIPDERWKGTFGVTFFDSDRQAIASGSAVAANAGAIVNAALLAAPSDRPLFFQIFNADPPDILGSGSSGGLYAFEVKIEPAEVCTLPDDTPSTRGSCKGSGEACVQGKCLAQKYYDYSADYAKRRAKALEDAYQKPSKPKPSAPAPAPSPAQPGPSGSNGSQSDFFAAIFAFLRSWFGGGKS